MQGYLFPMERRSHSDPYREFLSRMLPGAKRSVFLVDPSPTDEIIAALVNIAPKTVNKRILIRRDIMNLGDSTPPDILKSESRRLIQDNHIDVRALSRLSARLVVVDDTALVISGDPWGELCWGIELNAVDSQPVLDFWNERYHEASRISDTQSMAIWDSYQERFWCGQVEARDVVTIYNRRGAFIDIQVRIFSGYRQLTLYPFASSGREGPRGPVIRWRFIDSIHYQHLGKLASKIHGLKTLSLIRDTPAGSYLKRCDLADWEQMFSKREQEFRQAVSEYLDMNYAEMREESLKFLTQQFIDSFHQVQEKQQLLPMLNEDYVREQAEEIHHQHFPSKETLLFACHARYILYGLHPDAASDKVLIDSLAASAVSDILL